MPQGPSPRHVESARSWRLGHGLLIGAILLVSGAAGWWTRAPEVGLGGDEATYILLSHSLEQGRYHDEFRVGAPPHAKYPPGTPLWIALVRRVTGPDLDHLRAANLCLLLLTALLIGDAVRRLSGPWPGIAGVALTAWSPWLLNSAGTGLSEAPFAFLAGAALWVTLLPGSEQRSGKIGAAFGAAAASFLTRSVGLTVIAGVIAWLVSRRRWRAAGVVLVGSGLLVGGWFLYTARVDAGTDGRFGYGADLSRIASADTGGLAGLLQQFITNAKAYLLALPVALGVPSLPGSSFDNVVTMVVLGIAGAVGLVFMLRRWPAAGVHLLAGSALLLVWPWADERLLIPLLPFFGAAILTGTAGLGGKVGGRIGVIAPVVVGGVLATWGLTGYLRRDPFHRCDRDDPYADARCFPPETLNAMRAIRLIRDSAPAGAVVATGKPATVYYFSGRQTLSLPYAFRSGGASEVLDPGPDRGVWILLTPLGPRDQAAAKRLLERGCDGLSVRERSSGALVLVQEPATSTPAGDACGALREFARDPPR